jgi:hypothetical protein
MSTKIEVTPATDAAWNDRVRMVPHDVYHTREYNLTAGLGVSETSTTNSRASVTSQSLLFSYEKNGMVFLFPHVLRTLEDVLGPEGKTLFDVTSLYGYGGPLASENASPEFLRDAWLALMDTWKAQRVVSVFTRFHPLLNNVELTGVMPDAMFEGQSSLLCGSTVSINLDLPEEEQFRRYQKNLRNELRKAYSTGFQVNPVPFDTSSDKFLELYSQTMRRRNASGQYLIDERWLAHFGDALKDHCCLLEATLHDEVTAMLLVMEYQGYVHAHLTGIDEQFISHSPLKPLLDGTRRWASARGNKVLHLGGGIGARRDSLFRFKSHFSPDTNSFHIGCWILNRKIYDELSGTAEAETLVGPDSKCDEPKPFPAYRFVSHGQVAELASHH